VARTSQASPQDLVVLGGGTAGLVSAVGAAGVGARVTLIEEDRTGGDCLWTGCVPSKALLSAARVVHAARTADRFGLGTAELSVDLGAVMDAVRVAQDTIAPHDSPERLRSEGVTVLAGRARLAGPGLVEVALADGGGTTTLRTRTALLATGSRVMIPPVEGLAEANPLTSDTVWQLRELPRRLVVLGGGPIGCELGQAFARLGSDVTLVEMADSLVPREEPEAGAVLRDVLLGEGVTVRVATRAVRVEESPEGRVLTVETTDDRHQSTRIPFDQILVAAGRAPCTDDLGLEAAGVELTASGHVAVDSSMRTSQRWVFAAGDVTGLLPFTHAAGSQAGLVVTNALFGLKRRFDAERVPWATFTEPEIGRIGLTEAEAIARHGTDEVEVARFDMARLDRAIAAKEPHGFVKLIAGPKDKIIGATIMGAHGGDIIATVAAYMSQGATLSDVGQVTQTYPTFAEAPGKAAGEVLRGRFLSPRTRGVAKPVLSSARALRKPWRNS
jgi:pyruvate/2-oxoglutarate dehydrogenase complex dihydrolipoamide dehydrogenase (E3) component